MKHIKQNDLNIYVNTCKFTGDRFLSADNLDNDIINICVGDYRFLSEEYKSSFAVNFFLTFNLFNLDNSGRTFFNTDATLLLQRDNISSEITTIELYEGIKECFNLSNEYLIEIGFPKYLEYPDFSTLSLQKFLD